MAKLTQADDVQLLKEIEQALDLIVVDGTQLQVDPSGYDVSVQREAASFVTLRREYGALRGCMGSSVATRPLICDVAANTHAAATRDPRFACLTRAERPGLHLSVSVLSALEPLTVTDTDDLVRQLRPGVDGLLLVDGRHRGTLLPAVWDLIADPERFVTEVKTKAGWAPHYWSSTLVAFRYTAQSFGPS